MAYALRKGPYSAPLDEDLLKAFNMNQIADDNELLEPAEFLSQLIMQMTQNDPDYGIPLT